MLDGDIKKHSKLVFAFAFSAAEQNMLCQTRAFYTKMDLKPESAF